MKALTWIFGFGVLGVAVSLGMGIYTGIRGEKDETQTAPISIPTPAGAQ